MRKIQIIGLRKLLDDCIRTMHALSVVHIEDLQEGGARDSFIRKLPLDPDKIEEKKSLQVSLKKLEDLLTLLTKPRGTTKRTVSYGSLQKTLAELESVEKTARDLACKKDSITESIGSINRYERILKVFAPMISKFASLKNIEVVGITIDGAKLSILEDLEKEISNVTAGAYMLYKMPVDESLTGVLIAHNKAHGDALKKLLTGEAINEVVLPEGYRELPFLGALTKMITEKEELSQELLQINADIGDISSKWYDLILGARAAIIDALEELGAINYCGGSEHSFVVEGWIPSGKLNTVKTSMETAFPGKVIVRELPFDESEERNVPVFIKNPRFIKAFEIFLGFLPTPLYRAVDPTPWIAIFFPVFFGLIVGDLGYGLVLFSISLYMRRRLSKKPFLRDITEIMCISTAVAAAFGGVFGEFFGNLGEEIGLFTHPIFDRAHALKTFLAISIGIGIGHVLLGLAIAAINHLFKKKLIKAAEKASMLLLLTLFLMLIAKKMGYVPHIPAYPLVISFLILFAVLAALESVIGIVEFMKAVSNILSYARIMAVGTASVVLALIANKAGSMVGNIAVGIAITVLFHAANIVLSVVTPAVQSLRLQYVEFLSKFYEGGGRKYTPFKKNG